MLIAGFGLISCDSAVQGGNDSVYGASDLPEKIPAGDDPTLESWTQITNYAPNGGGGHCVYGAGLFVSANYNDGTLDLFANPANGDRN